MLELVRKNCHVISSTSIDNTLSLFIGYLFPCRSKVHRREKIDSGNDLVE